MRRIHNKRWGVRILSWSCIYFAAASFYPLQLFAATISLTDPNTGEDSGWTAEWHPLFDSPPGVPNLVNILVDEVTPTSVLIRKVATFTQGPGSDETLPPIPITFKQVDPNAVSLIVINDEILNNETGVAWTDFHMVLFEHGDAWFDEALTEASNGGLGFNTSPFTQHSFSPAGPNPTVFDMFGGGVVPIGGTFLPGAGPSGGELYIRVNTHTGASGDPFANFTLKEFPTIPEPTTMWLAIFGAGLIGLRRGS